MATMLIDCTGSHSRRAESEKQYSLLMRVKEDRDKAGLKLNIQKAKIIAYGPITLMANRWANNGNSDRLYCLGLQNHCRQ